MENLRSVLLNVVNSVSQWIVATLTTIRTSLEPLGTGAMDLLRDHDWVLVIFTGLLVVFNALLAIYIYRLWRTTKEDTRILQRAYIAVEPFGIHGMFKGNGVIGHVAIKNAGHLPARGLSSFIEMRWSKNGAEPKMFFPLKCGEGNIVIAPGSVAIAASRTMIDNKILIEACGGETAAGTALENEVFLYVWGYIHYDNGFGRMCTTRFCHRYNWESRNSDNTPTIAKYSIAAELARYHEHGNDAD